MDVSEVEHVQCDECNEAFRIRLIEKPHPGNIIETYFKCPSCDAKYITHVTDHWARQEQKRIAKLNIEYVQRKSKLSIRMAKLKEKVAST